MSRKPKRVGGRRFSEANGPADVDGFIDERGKGIKQHELQYGAHRDGDAGEGVRRYRAPTFQDA